MDGLESNRFDQMRFWKGSPCSVWEFVHLFLA